MSLHITWPPERFYWALVPGAPWKGSGEPPAGLLALAEDDLPVPAESLHAVGTTVEGGVLVCAASRSNLEAVDPSVLSLHPAAAPAGLEVACERLNLLVGPFEPAPVRRARFRRHALGAGTLLIVLLLLSLGLARRASLWNERAGVCETAWRAEAAEVVPDSQENTVLLDLQRKAGRLEQARAVQTPVDAAVVLTGLLGSWPAEVPSKPQSITVRDRVASVSVLVEDAPGFLAAMKPPIGWALDQPMLNSAGELTRLSLTFHAAGATTEVATAETSP